MSTELMEYRGFMPWDEPLTWADLKEIMDDSVHANMMDGREIVSIESIAFGEHEIDGTMRHGILVISKATGPLNPSEASDEERARWREAADELLPPLRKPKLIKSYDAVRDLPDGAVLRDANGDVWALKSVRDDAWLCPFSDEYAFTIKADGSGVELGHSPALPLVDTGIRAKNAG